jgi:hypothetical protein
MVVRQAVTAFFAVVLVTGAVTGAALAQGGGGGGGGGKTPDVVLATPQIAPGTFDGIGPGPVYLHDSFGFAQRTRYAANGSIVDVVDKEVNGIRAEYPNNRSETWISGNVGGAASWNFASVGPSDPFEPVTPLQVNEFGYNDGILAIVGAEIDTPDTRPAALRRAPRETSRSHVLRTAGFTLGVGGAAGDRCSRGRCSR